jgi:hypothetical protein
MHVTPKNLVKPSGLLKGLVAVSSLGLIWLVILPWLGERAAVRYHVETLHAADVNASAMFYSELECKYLLAR